MPKAGDEQELQSALFLHQQGSLPEAASLYRKLIKLNANNFHALHFLGVIEAGLGNIEQAKLLMARSMSIQPPNVQFIENYATILFQSGDYKSALQVCQQGLQHNKANTSLMYVKAVSLAKLSRLKEAVAQFDELLSLEPNQIVAINERGSLLAEMNLYDEALASFTKALTLNPKYAEAHLNIGNLYAELNRNDEAFDAYDKALAFKADLADAWLGRGNVFSKLKRYNEAIASYDKAIAQNPDFAKAYNYRGNVLTYNGSFTAAVESYKRALEIKPDFVECFLNYTKIAKIDRDDPFLPKMRKLLNAGHLSENDLLYLRFALAKAEHDLGNEELYIDHLIQGNAIKKKELAYDISQDERLFASIKQYFDFDPANEQSSLASNYAATPIFILGMPRSGTTLVEQIVSSHDDVFGAGELECLDQAISNSKWQFEKDRQKTFGAVRSFYNKKISEISDAAIVTDKMPLNFRWIGFIINAFPNAKIVHLERDPAAVCWSNFKTYFGAKGMAFAFDLEDIAKYYRLYRELMDFWREKYPKRIYDLNYEKLTEYQEEETRKLFDYLELEWQDNVLEFHKNERSVSTASCTQVRQEMYKGSSLEWKQYEQWLQPMLEVLYA